MFGDDEPRAEDWGGPTPASALARLLNRDDLGELDATFPEVDLAERVMDAISRVADHLDSGVLATDDVSALSDEELGTLFATLMRDRDLATAHRPVGSDPTCPAGCSSSPCETLRRLALVYLGTAPR